MKDKIAIVIIFLLTLIAGWSLLQPGLPPTHDGEYHVVRFYEFDKVLRQGNWYPRWAPDLNNGYGVPLFNFVYPLPNYVASLLHFFGTSFIDAFKLNMFIASFLGAFFMYLWARNFWGSWGGVISSIFYTYSPYHFLDIYIRGSVGEVWALGLFPAFLWAITKLLKEKNTVFLPITSIFLALIIFSHNILALMFFPFAVSYAVFLIYQEKNRKYLILNTLYTMLIGLGLSSIFWLPAIFERGYVRGLDIFDYKRHFVEIYQFLFPSWGSGFSADPTSQGLSFQIGIANLIVIGLITFLLIWQRERVKAFGLITFMLVWILVAIFLMLPVSEILWQRMPFMQYVQFPWRLLSVVILCSSFLVGSLFHIKKSHIFAIVLGFLAISLSINYIKPAYYHMRDDGYYITRSNFIDGTNSPGNAFNTIWFNDELTKATARIEEKGEVIKINTAYFPGWQVFVDGKKVKTTVDKDGLIQANRPSQGGIVEVKFIDTPIRSLAKIISLGSLLATFLLIVLVRVRM